MTIVTTIWKRSFGLFLPLVAADFRGNRRGQNSSIMMGSMDATSSHRWMDGWCTAVQELEIPAEERNLLCRNMGWCVRTRPSFPTEPTLISELLKDAIQLRKAQDCIRKAKEDGTLVIDNEMD